MEKERDLQMTGEMQLVSVIVPVYNVEKYLEKCLESIAKQSYKNLKIILVDDGSTDASPQICDAFANRDNRVVVYHNENHGPGYSRNYGIDRSEGDFIIFMDSDDWVDENYVMNLVWAITETESDIAISPWYLELFDHTEINRTNPKQLTGKLSDDFVKFYGFACGSCQKLYRRDLIDENKIRFEADRVYSEDRVFNCEYLRNIKSYVYVDNPQYHYRLYNESSLTHRMTEKAYDDALYGLKKEKEFMTDIHAAGRREMINDSLFGFICCFRQTKETGDDYQAFCKRFRKAKSVVPVVWSTKTVKRMIAGIAYTCNMPWIFYIWYRWKYHRD